MELADLRNTLREWFRDRQAETPLTQGLTLVVPNEGVSTGVEETHLRFSIQTGKAAVIGVGSGLKRRRRVGRVFIEVFGETAVGDGTVSEIATAVEQIWRDAMEAAAAPHPHITVQEPFSFERSENNRYCQVVSVPIEVDHFS